MSTTTTPPAIDVSQTPRVPFLRLVGVELRKLVDTRAGRWLLGITFGILLLVTAVILVIAAFQDELRLSLGDWQGTLTFLMSLLLPAIAIISITQEWGQRTGLVTFALEPNRLRVVLSKLTAVVTLAVLTLLFAAAVAVVAHLLMGVITGESVEWVIDGEDLGWSLFFQIAYFIMAFGFGMVFLSTPTAIVLYYVVALVLPQMVYGIIYFLVSWGPSVLPWIDFGFAVAAYTGEMPPAQDGSTAPDFGIAPIIVSTFIWVVLPFVIGLLRIRRVELK